MSKLEQILSIVAERALTPDEKQELIVLLEQYSFDDVSSSFVESLELLKHPGSMDAVLKSGILESIYAATETIKKPVIIAHRVHFLRTAWFRYAAAIILFAGIGVAGYFISTKTSTTGIARQGKPTLTPAENILPGSNKAVLTLSDGRRVELDSATSGTISDQNLSIENNNGQLKYGSSELVVYNTMTTPRGGQYQVLLPDGTKVWLNAASSITYPTAFTGTNRTVNIEGEAYFEVARFAKKPFIVTTYKDEITVLGTEFNINSYKDERTIKTSLVEGRVKINEIVLKPGEAYENGKVKTTNIAQDIAWKNGIFNFEGQNLTTVMRQIERWYDVQVKYQGTISNSIFAGKMDRGVKLSGVIRFLQQYGLTVALEGKELIIKK